jgi:glutathione S-transferase
VLRHPAGAAALKLHWSPKSPFVRKVMIAAHECGVAQRIELMRSVAMMAQPNATLMADNPLNKIPTLVLDDGTSLFDSTVICEYLDELNPSRATKLFPRHGAARWDALRRNALGSGLLDVLILWRNERERTAPSEALLKAFETKTVASLTAIESALRASPTERFDIGDIAMGCALGYLDFRFATFGWRAAYPSLGAWYARFSLRPSVQATPVVDDRATQK